MEFVPFSDEANRVAANLEQRHDAWDRAQGELLLDAARERMAVAYPLDVDFVLSLPEELRELFNAWASSRGYVPR